MTAAERVAAVVADAPVLTARQRERITLVVAGTRTTTTSQAGGHHA